MLFQDYDETSNSSIVIFLIILFARSQLRLINVEELADLKYNYKGA
jgi:hypothetical protein